MCCTDGHYLRARSRRDLEFSTAPAVADPGFRPGGAPTPRGGRQHTILPIFPENCMKLKEFGPRGGVRPKFYYVDPILPCIACDVLSCFHLPVFTPHDICRLCRTNSCHQKHEKNPVELETMLHDGSQ